MPSARPTQPAWQTHCIQFSTLPHRLSDIKSPETIFSDYKIILKSAPFCPTGHVLLYAHGSPPALPLTRQLSYSPAVPRSPWQRALRAARDGVIIPLCSVSKTPVQWLSLVLLSPLQASSSALSLSRRRHPLISPSSQLVYATSLPALCKEPPAFSRVLPRPPCPPPPSCRSGLW